jgi:hypothetical protein
MATQDSELVRLVAARYPQMQGLRRIADAMWPLLLAEPLVLWPIASAASRPFARQ